MRRLTLAQIGHILDCPESFPLEMVHGYCTDSRSLKSGELFFALKGEQVDGHSYLDEVKKRGAIGAVVSKDFHGYVEGLSLIAVEDPLHALQELGRIILEQTPTRIVAITGSVGKTSTKEFSKSLLRAKYQVAATPGNSNSQIGLPLTILNHTTGEEEILILEMGLTAAGHLSRLVQIAPPEVAVLTSVALVHACNFESIEDIAWAKSEIFSHFRTRLGILHRDISNFEEICRVGTCHKLSFSITSDQADYGVASFEPLVLQEHSEKQTVTLGSLPFPGKHNIQNLMAAILIARYFKLDWKEIRHAIHSLILPDRRLQFIRYLDVLFLNDSYNACELSIKAALETLPPSENKGRKIAVLGSMLELGKFSEVCHQRVGEFALKYVEHMYCLGEECLPIYEVWKKAGRPVYFFKNRKDLVARLRLDLRPADVVLLKGSYSKELWKVLEEL